MSLFSFSQTGFFPDDFFKAGATTTISTGGITGLEPKTGTIYRVKNVAQGHFLDSAFSDCKDKNPVLAWSENRPETDNQKWLYRKYPVDSGETVFTLQNASTTRQKNAAGEGGYLSIGKGGSKLVQSSVPFAWKLIKATDNHVYGFVKYTEDEISIPEQALATDAQDHIKDAGTNQVTMAQLNGCAPTTQMWVFTE